MLFLASSCHTNRLLVLRHFMHEPLWSCPFPPTWQLHLQHSLSNTSTPRPQPSLSNISNLVIYLYTVTSNTNLNISSSASAPNQTSQQVSLHIFFIIIITSTLSTHWIHFPFQIFYFNHSSVCPFSLSKMSFLWPHNVRYIEYGFSHTPHVFLTVCDCQSVCGSAGYCVQWSAPESLVNNWKMSSGAWQSDVTYHAPERMVH